jgi:hypothetical protein
MTSHSPHIAVEIHNNAVIDKLFSMAMSYGVMKERLLFAMRTSKIDHINRLLQHVVINALLFYR